MAVVERIGATNTKAGLIVECAVDESTYETGNRISKAEMKLLDIEGDAFHPDWNYAIQPRRPDKPWWLSLKVFLRVPQYDWSACGGARYR